MKTPRRVKHRHRCAAFPCRSYVPFDFLMCKKHWALVPRALQIDAYRAWDNGNPSPAWNAAVARAVAAVCKQGELLDHIDATIADVARAAAAV